MGAHCIIQQGAHAWNSGGGWNSAGSEAPAMREWAKQNLIHTKTNREKK